MKQRTMDDLIHAYHLTHWLISSPRGNGVLKITILENKIMQIREQSTVSRPLNSASLVRHVKNLY